MRPHQLRDDQWDLIRNELPGRAGSVGVSAANNRRFVDAVIHRYRTGIPWRDLPESFGDWNNTHRRWSRWAKSGVWGSILGLLTKGADNEYAMIDSRYCASPSTQRRRQKKPGKKAYDADKRVIELLEAAGKTAVIPPKQNRNSPRSYDKAWYVARHLIENFFCWVKQFRAIATRYDKTARNFAIM